MNGSLALIGPIDPPPDAHRFALPTEPLTYAARGYLQPAAEQVEFAHCLDPSTPAQLRAAQLRSCLAQLRPDAFLMLHNDISARSPYLYANSAWPDLESTVRAMAVKSYDDGGPPEDLNWTHRLGERTYAFFPCERIGVHGSFSAGLFIQDQLGITTLTLELPIFDWGAAESARLGVLAAISQWAKAGGSAGVSTARFVAEVKQAVGACVVPMVPAPRTASTIWAVLDALACALGPSTSTQLKG